MSDIEVPRRTETPKGLFLDRLFSSIIDFEDKTGCEIHGIVIERANLGSTVAEGRKTKLTTCSLLVR